LFNFQKDLRFLVISNLQTYEALNIDIKNN